MTLAVVKSSNLKFNKIERVKTYTYCFYSNRTTLQYKLVLNQIFFKVFVLLSTEKNR